MGALYWAIGLIAVAVWFKRRKRLTLPLPPGPPGDPILGHLRYIPPESPENTFAEWSKTYGDVMHVRVLNRNMIILNTVEAAVDLMDKRSAIYSDRPDFPIFKMMGWVPSLTFTGYGKEFQKHRRLIQQTFTKQKIEEYRHIQVQEAHRLAINLIDQPDNRETMLRRFSTSIIMQIAFGHEVVSDDDVYLQIAKDTGYSLTHCGPPGSTPVDLFPFLAHLPSWFPGTFFAQRAKGILRTYIQTLHEYPFAEVQKQMAQGTAKPCFLTHHLEQLHNENNETEEELEDIKGAAATIYCAAADTTWSAMSTFMLAMSIHPECQERAQQELDGLLGGSRLPEFEDRESLPYVECIIQETHRWLNAVPFGIPHRTVEDDVYKGMFIPKGSLVFANTRGISQNEAVYHDPRSFKPIRYLPKSQGGYGEPFPQAQFGFGRRICPGRHLADVSLYFAISTILALFDVKKGVGANGNEITPEVGQVSGLTSHTKPYQTRIQLRNEQSKKLLDQTRVEVMSG